MIELKDVSVVFGGEERDVQAVKDVTISISPGDIYGIVGYSGAGKSTLVRTINVLQRPTSGSVTVDGQDMLALSGQALRQARKKIGMIFQHFNLMEQRTIFENVAFPLKGSGLSKEQIRAKVAELLALVGLEEKFDVYPSQLSGGQKQRVAIARALANDPQVLLCDEATSALDPKTTSSILDLLKELNQKLNLTIVIITHEMSVVKDICDRVAVMENGEVLEQGTILEIFTNPTRPLTKEFINTATHFDQEMKVVLEHPTTRQLSQDGHLIRLNYAGGVTTDPIIAEIVRRFQVDVNILYGHVEILQQTPVGNLLVSVKGDEKAVQEAIAYIEAQGVRVTTFAEILKEFTKKKGSDQ